MISLSFNFHKETETPRTTSVTTSYSKKQFTARQIYTLIKKAKKRGYKVGTYVGTHYTDKPLGQIVGFIVPPTEGITVWGDTPSIVKIEGYQSKQIYTYRAEELVLYKVDKSSGEFVPC